MNTLSKVIEVDPEKCVNCHACIGVCPVKYCNNAMEDHVEVNADLCIACGSCIAACTHEARGGVDDFAAFLDAAGRGEKIIAISALADSPMLHTVKMIRAFYPQYKHYKVMVLSPCYAKRREFDDTGFGDYNVTYKSLQDYIDKNSIQLRTFTEIEFENTEAERAVLFSTPGGLMRTVERELPGAAGITRKIEGPHTVYEYFKTLPEMIRLEFAPALIDCLNCEKGCNGSAEGGIEILAARDL